MITQLSCPGFTQSRLLGGSPVESLQSHLILTMSHWPSGLPVCFPPEGTQVQIPWGDLCETEILLLALSRYRVNSAPPHGKDKEKRKVALFSFGRRFRFFPRSFFFALLRSFLDLCSRARKYDSAHSADKDVRQASRILYIPLVLVDL